MPDQTPAAQIPAAAPAPAPAPQLTPVEQRAAFLSNHQTDTGAASTPTPPPSSLDPSASPQLATKPDGLPDSFWDKDKGAIKGGDLKKHFEESAKFKADVEAARGAIPATADDYKAELPKDFKLPDGMPELPPGMEFNQSDPRLIALRKIAHERGFSQETFSALLETEALNVSSLIAKFKERDAALGENAAGRLSELGTWLNASFDKDTVTDIGSAFVFPRVVKAFESMKKALTSQGVGNFNAGGRESPEANDGKPANWDTMRPVDRIVWTRQQQREGARNARH